MSVVEEITKLTEEWYFLIGKEHHKDRCCHWYIETKWSYGQPPKYFAQHFGYLLHDIEEEFDSYEEALNGLKEILKKEIKQFKEDGDENI
jgi:hypothetical protein